MNNTEVAITRDYATPMKNEDLSRFVDKIQRLKEEVTALNADIREVFADAKGQGFDTKVMKKLIWLKEMEFSDRNEFIEMLDRYCQATGVPVQLSLL